MRIVLCLTLILCSCNNNTKAVVEKRHPSRLPLTQDQIYKTVDLFTEVASKDPMADPEKTSQSKVDIGKPKHLKPINCTREDDTWVLVLRYTLRYLKYGKIYDQIRVQLAFEDATVLDLYPIRQETEPSVVQLMVNEESCAIAEEGTMPLDTIQFKEKISGKGQGTKNAWWTLTSDFEGVAAATHNLIAIIKIDPKKKQLKGKLNLEATVCKRSFKGCFIPEDAQTDIIDFQFELNRETRQ